MLFEDLKSLETNDEISKNDILKILKKWAENVSVFDIMNSTSKFRESCKYVKEEYKGHFDDIYVKNFYMRIKDIKKDNKDYKDNINKKTFLKAIDYFKKQDDQRKVENKIKSKIKNKVENKVENKLENNEEIKLENEVEKNEKDKIKTKLESKENGTKVQRLIYYLICIYTTFILDEPIHHVGSIFPGNTKVRYENGTYYCPVKNNNVGNLKAVCRFCIAKQG